MALSGAIALIGAACLVLVPRAPAARAVPDTIESYRTFGVARGAELAFTFKGSLFEPLLHIGLPYARAGLKSEAGATGAAVAAQLYPGDLIASQIGDNFPGLATAAYPPGRERIADVAPFPADGPLVADAGRVRAEATAAHAIGHVTTAGGAFSGGEAPLLSIGAVRVTSEATKTEAGVVQTVRSAVSGLELHLADGVSIRIEDVVSLAEAASDGSEGTAEASLTVGGAVVEMGGQVFEATVDDRGVHLSEPLQDVLGVPLDLEQTIRAGLRQLGISITTAGPVEITDGASADASVGGLVIGLTGEIPIVPVPQAFAQLLSSVNQQLPPEVNDPVCFQDIDPNSPLPLCIGANFLPGPGSGMVQTLSLGNVNAIAGANLAPPNGGGDDGGDGDGGGFDGGTGGGNGSGGNGGGGGGNGGGGGGGGGGNDGGGEGGFTLSGLLARMPPGVALGFGLALFALAALVSLVPFRPADEDDG
jgi:hypothetical protein